MKPKVALVKDGFLPAGSENKRGRLSTAAIDRLKTLAAQGWTIDGYSVSKSDNTDEPVKVSKVSVDPNRIADVPDESRSENDWTAFVNHAGKAVEVGMREVCNACGNSFTYCRCEKPLFWVDYQTQGVVNFKPRVQSKPKG